MGYYTNYTLKAKPITQELYSELVTSLEEMELLGYTFDEEEYDEDEEIAVFDAREPVKWYKHDEDMIKISIQFPDTTFLLEGEGEDNTDFWRSYYHNGEMELCQGEIHFEPPTTIKW